MLNNQLKIGSALVALMEMIAYNRGRFKQAQGKNAQYTVAENRKELISVIIIV